MKDAEKHKTSRLSIEVFNPRLLKETKLWESDEFTGEEEQEYEVQDDQEEDFDELSLDDFESTL